MSAEGTSNPKCKICNKELSKLKHEPCSPSEKGDIIGSSTELAKKILINLRDNGGNYNVSWKSKYIHLHPLYAGNVYFYKQEEDGSVVPNMDVQRDGSIQAHHLICCESMKDSVSWENYTDYCGFDINEWYNGIFLPSRMEVACHLALPLHKLNHNEGATNRRRNLTDADRVNPSFNIEDLPYLFYPEAVMEELKQIEQDLKRQVYCKNKSPKPVDPKKLLTRLHKLSTKILEKVEQFKWKLTYDGGDYKTGGPGCKGQLGIKIKKNAEDAAALNNININCTRVHTMPLKGFPNAVEKRKFGAGERNYTPRKVTNPLKVGS